MPEPNYYKILQVDPSAEPEVIAAAYRRLAQKYHPDANPSSQATRQMQEINEAYRVLSDPVDRERYTRELLSSPRNTTRQSEQFAQQKTYKAGGVGRIVNFISVASLLIVVAGFIFAKVGLLELVLVIILAVIITTPQIIHLDDRLRGKKK